MLEAGVALFLLVFIVWWTMFSGKKPTRQAQQKTLPPKDDAQH
jgi:cbb3-type cytochrome oxidase subunit 3